MTEAPLVSIDPELGSQVRALIAERSGRFAVAIREGSTGKGLLIAERETFPSASLYKLAVLYETYRQIEAGTLAPDERLPAPDLEQVEDEPPGGIRIGESVTVIEAARRMTIVSSNAAARLLVERLGRSRINRSLSELGLQGTRLSSGASGSVPVLGRDYSVTSALDMLLFFERLRRGELVNPKASRQMQTLLEEQRINDRIPEPLPDGVRVAHKTGDLEAVAHDAGLVSTGATGYVIAVLTQDADRAIAIETIQQISRLTFRRYGGK